MKADKPTIHYAAEYGADGMPTRLTWSPEIQAAGDAREKEWREKRESMDSSARKPMECYVEWAKERGLWR